MPPRTAFSPFCKSPSLVIRNLREDSLFGSVGTTGIDLLLPIRLCPGWGCGLETRRFEPGIMEKEDFRDVGATKLFGEVNDGKEGQEPLPVASPPRLK